VEGFFAELTTQRLQPGAFRSVADRQAAINRLLAKNGPQRFVWTADLERVVASARGTQISDSIHYEGG
jgi:hypothetical protein